MNFHRRELNDLCLVEIKHFVFSVNYWAFSNDII
jgi:hypothetical protein